MRLVNLTVHWLRHMHDQEDLVVIKNTRWANLPAEVLRDVMKKLDESESTWPDRKQVVACAGVCKTWRLMCKDIVKSPEFSGKLTFPVSLKQPGPRDGTIHCFIKRDKSNMTYHLYLSLSPSLLFESGKFLLSAKRTRRATYIEYVISMDADNISQSSSSYIGKMRSNFLGTKFVIYNTAPAHNGCQIMSSPSRSRRFSSKKVSPKVPSGSYNIAQVTYELNLLGTRGPRKMHYIMHSIRALALGQPELLQHSFDESFGSIGSSKIIDHSGDFSSARFSDIVGSQEEEGKERTLVLKNKPPRWHGKLRCWCLHFRGRVTVASVKNFQLMSAATVQPGPDSGAGALTTKPSASALAPQPGPSDHDQIILQFGKVDKDMFTMDYRYPLSAFQAFAICLSSFDTKLACE
ncbi:F-box-like domain superfamily [Arabidopsis suecica]|uniref:Tubby-like F-box protein n=1 Tax=Arabidopsis suecica TaxID=45249 RepID=A0A8T2CPF1_ARASU|nr:F-box-like domain superfamily [Arabidopsis suecica]